MFERSSKKTNSTVSARSGNAAVTFGTDLNRDPVYLSGSIRHSVSFAEAMRVLGQVVRIQKPAPKDHSEYQAWVEQEYIKVLNQRMPGVFAQQKDLSADIKSLRKKRDSLTSHLTALFQSASFADARQRFFDWLYEHDRQAWILLDPIVSVQRDGTFFEAFSGDESVYARVFLPHTALENKRKPTMGTTNIDFSLLLEREFDRVRSYRPMQLTVGLKAVDFKTEAAVIEEEKIPLPETWVTGLVEVQSVLALAPVTFDISADAMAEIIARLQGEKEKSGPRSLKFMLEPGKPVRIELEPWGEVFADDWFSYEGSTSTEIRIWGRRRLFVLKDILVHADKVRVHFLGSGMPSFWTVINDDIELTVGLSGWTSNDWASKARFSSFIPSEDVAQEKLEQGLQLLVDQGSLTTSDLAQQLGMGVSETSAILQKLCLQGKAMFDPTRGVYRWRDLFPTLDLFQESDASRESKAGLDLAKANAVQKTLDELKGEVRYLSGAVKDKSGNFAPLLELDQDNRPKYAQCTCPFYNYNKLKQGPCRHMIALSIRGGEK